MPKYLLPTELAEIVCGLLVQPALLNELKTPATHKAFMQDIGELVAKHCGGQIDGVIMPEVRDEDSQADYLTSPDETPYIVVSPGQDMHSLTDNVWRHHARDGGLTISKAVSKKALMNCRPTKSALYAATPSSVCSFRKKPAMLICQYRWYGCVSTAPTMLSRPILQQSLTSQWRSVVMPCWQ